MSPSSPSPSAAKTGTASGREQPETRNVIPDEAGTTESTDSHNDPSINAAANSFADRPNIPQRILILARGGPLLLDVWLTLDGRPFDESLAALVERVQKAGDPLGSGRPTWSQWSNNKTFLQGDLANLNPIQKRRLRQWIERFDENKDDQIQAAEAAAWLGRESGRSAAALTLRSRRAYFSLASTNSRLWRLLDANGDTQLRADELEMAPAQLLRRDTNDDRIITSSELATLRDQLDAQTGPRMSSSDRSARPAAIHLTDDSDVDRLDYVLGDLYAPRQQLGPASFSARPRLFATLDDDGNQRLDRKELARLLEIEPHVKLSLDFSWDAQTGSATSELMLLQHTPEVELVIEPTAHRKVLITEDARLIISAHDLRDSRRSGQAAQQSQVRLMIHDRNDDLFDTLDANANGRLDEREIAAAADRLRACDANGDRRLTENELLVSMTVAFLRSEPAGEESFYVPNFDARSAPKSAATSRQEIDPPAWFRDADFNGDDDISRSEFLGTSAQFTALDTNQDGFISSDEARSPDGNSSQ